MDARGHAACSSQYDAMLQQVEHFGQLLADALCCHASACENQHNALEDRVVAMEQLVPGISLVGSLKVRMADVESFLAEVVKKQTETDQVLRRQKDVHGAIRKCTVQVETARQRVDQ